MVDGHSYISRSKRPGRAAESSGSLFPLFGRRSAVRTGLVIVGAALLIVGGVLGYIGVTAPGGSTTHDLASARTISAPNLYPNQSRSADVPLVATDDGVVSIAWNATQSISVDLYRGAPCADPTQYCASGPALAVWPSNLTGLWNASGTVSSPLILELVNHHATNASFTAFVAEEYVLVTALRAPTWSVVAILVGAGLLLAIGGVVTFLGLFLRGGVYDEPESVRPRYYASELDRVDDLGEAELDGDPDGYPDEPDPAEPGRGPAH